MASSNDGWIEVPDDSAGWVEVPDAPAREGQGWASSALKGAEQGLTLGSADEIGAGLQAGMQWIANKVPGGYEQDPMEVYRAARGENRAIYKEAQEDNPEAYLAGEVAGGVLLPIPGAGAAKAAVTLTRGARLANTAKTGAAMGGAYGLGSSEGDLTKGEIGEVAADTGLGALLGGAFGAAGEGLIQGAGSAKDYLKQKLLEKVRPRLATANDELASLASQKVSKELQSANGYLGSATREGNRGVENLMRLEQAGALTAKQADRLQSLKNSGEWSRLQQELAESELERLPQHVSEMRSHRGARDSLRENTDEAFERALEEVGNARAQVEPRLKRYAAPLAGVALGPAAGMGVGFLSDTNAALSGLAGAGARPAIQAITRMARHPAVRKVFLEKMQSIAGRKTSGFVNALEAAAQKGERAFTTTAFVLGQRHPEMRKLLEALASGDADKAEAEVAGR